MSIIQASLALCQFDRTALPEHKLTNHACYEPSTVLYCSEAEGPLCVCGTIIGLRVDAHSWHLSFAQAYNVVVMQVDFLCDEAVCVLHVSMYLLVCIWCHGCLHCGRCLHVAMAHVLTHPGLRYTAMSIHASCTHIYTHIHTLD